MKFKVTIQSTVSRKKKNSKYKKWTICDPENNLVGLCHSDT